MLIIFHPNALQLTNKLKNKTFFISLSPLLFLNDFRFAKIKLLIANNLIFIRPFAKQCNHGRLSSQCTCLFDCGFAIHDGDHFWLMLRRNAAQNIRNNILRIFSARIIGGENHQVCKLCSKTAHESRLDGSLLPPRQKLQSDDQSLAAMRQAPIHMMPDCAHNR